MNGPAARLLGMTMQCCRHCSWYGPAHVYNLVWTHEWVCPSCMQLSPSAADCGQALVRRLHAAAVESAGTERAARAGALAQSLASVLTA